MMRSHPSVTAARPAEQARKKTTTGKRDDNDKDEIPPVTPTNLLRIRKREHASKTNQMIVGGWGRSEEGGPGAGCRARAPSLSVPAPSSPPIKEKKGKARPAGEARSYRPSLRAPGRSLCWMMAACVGLMVGGGGAEGGGRRSRRPSRPAAAAAAGRELIERTHARASLLQLHLGDLDLGLGLDDAVVVKSTALVGGMGLGDWSGAGALVRTKGEN